MPTEVLYAIIGTLLAAVVTLSGLWVRSIDEHRKWATERINDSDRKVAVIKRDFDELKQGILELKADFHEHAQEELKVHHALIRKFDLEVD